MSLSEAVMNPKRILLAVDENESSRNAIAYVGQLVGSQADFYITVMHVMESPPDDFFIGPSEQEAYLSDIRKRTDTLFEEARTTLIQCGVAPQCINFKTAMRSCSSLAECILEEALTSYGTLVVGRRGVKKSEELAFGSVSKRLLDFAAKCAIWVIH